MRQSSTFCSILLQSFSTLTSYVPLPLEMVLLPFLWWSLLSPLPSALQRLPSHATPVFRGVRNVPFGLQYDVGQELVWNAFSSTSTHVKVAAGFAIQVQALGWTCQCSVSCSMSAQPGSARCTTKHTLGPPTSPFVALKSFVVFNLFYFEHLVHNCFLCLSFLVHFHWSHGC